MSYKALSMAGELSFSPVDQRKAMKPFWPKRARSATAAGFGSIIGRNSFQRDKAAALRLLDGMVRIYQE
jgi:hypothetical protein